MLSATMRANPALFLFGMAFIGLLGCSFGRGSEQMKTEEAGTLGFVDSKIPVTAGSDGEK